MRTGLNRRWATISARSVVFGPSRIASRGAWSAAIRLGPIASSCGPRPRSIGWPRWSTGSRRWRGAPRRCRVGRLSVRGRAGWTVGLHTGRAGRRPVLSGPRRRRDRLPPRRICLDQPVDSGAARTGLTRPHAAPGCGGIGSRWTPSSTCWQPSRQSRSTTWWLSSTALSCRSSTAASHPGSPALSAGGRTGQAGEPRPAAESGRSVQLQRRGRRTTGCAPADVCGLIRDHRMGPPADRPAECCLRAELGRIRSRREIARARTFGFRVGGRGLCAGGPAARRLAGMRDCAVRRRH